MLTRNGPAVHLATTRPHWQVDDGAEDAAASRASVGGQRTCQRGGRETRARLDHEELRGRLQPLVEDAGGR